MFPRPPGPATSLLRKFVVFLFLAACVLPVAVHLHRSYRGAGDDALAPARVEASEHDEGQGRATWPRKALRPLPHSLPPDCPTGTAVRVLLIRELTTSVQLYVPPSSAADCAGATQDKEAAATAAERLLFACARLKGPPETEFLHRVTSARTRVASDPVVFVALVLPEHASTLRNDSFILWLDAAAQNSTLPADVRAAVDVSGPFVAPFLATAGKRAGACAPPGASR